MEPLKVEAIDKKIEEEIIKRYRKMGQRRKILRFGEHKYLFYELAYGPIGRELRSIAIRKDDVWIGGFPRSGTRWLSEMTWLLSNNLNYDEARRITLPNRILFFDIDYSATLENKERPVDSYDPTRRIDAMPSPRYLKTHLPLSLLPPGLLDTAKMVYIARDPRDVAVSYYHFVTKHVMIQYTGDFKTYWNGFVNDCVIFSPYFSNVKEYWRLRNHPNLLFLFYEEMREDLPNTARRVAKFLGQDYTDLQFETLCVYIKFSNMKKNDSVNNAPLLGEDCHQIIRKGEVGGWRHYFDEEMTRDAETWIAENLKDTDLKYPSMI